MQIKDRFSHPARLSTFIVVAACLAIPTQASSESANIGLTETSHSSVHFYVSTCDWADLHYTINNGVQQNVRMHQSDCSNGYWLDQLSAGDAIGYWFTYQTDMGAIDTPPQTHVFGDQSAPDSDADGVADNIDLCPDTPAGVQVDAKGCPVSTPPIALREITVTNGLLVGGPDSRFPGHTLYVFDQDLGSNGSNCDQECANTWPPVLITDGIASGVSGLDTFPRSDGTTQASYRGRPLYFYAHDLTAGQTLGQGQSGLWWTASHDIGDIVPLYNAFTEREPAIQYDRGDALVTRFSDRARDRHAREDQFQAYDHYLTFYWVDRTASIEILDYVAKGGSEVTMKVTSQFPLNTTQAENRWWYRGLNTVAEYLDNGVMQRIDDLHYVKTRSWNPKENREIRVGDRLEFELSQFLDPSVPNGRSNYYGTTFLYIVGEGIVPWLTRGHFDDKNSEREDSFKIDEQAWLGGRTTLPYMYSAEPDNHFMQMATNLGFDNAQPFVLGRRLHHTNFTTGEHDEPGNPIFDEMRGKSGTHYINTSCAACHTRNGRAAPVEPGVPLDKWVFKVSDEHGQPDPRIGKTLQPKNAGIDDATYGEGKVVISSWTQNNGLRSPNYAFTSYTPRAFSARIAPQLVGMGLLDAIAEDAILIREDEMDSNGDGISGKAHRVTDPVTGKTRLGRFGWKAGAASLKQQIAAALNSDMGVMTSIFPQPDCGTHQSQCGQAGEELSDEHLNNLVKYIALLGVRPQRDHLDPEVMRGKALFTNLGCDTCHTPSLQTSEFHPLAELRNQTIHPYSDLLLHDMGPGLADDFTEGQASGSEWRTTPLWGIGLSACVTGGVYNPTGTQGNERCTPVHSYLHDGRARSIEEAILWHGGESESAKQAFVALNASDKAALLRFLHSL